MFKHCIHFRYRVNPEIEKGTYLNITSAITWSVTWLNHPSNSTPLPRFRFAARLLSGDACWWDISSHRVTTTYNLKKIFCTNLRPPNKHHEPLGKHGQSAVSWDRQSQWSRRSLDTHQRRSQINTVWMAMHQHREFVQNRYVDRELERGEVRSREAESCRVSAIPGMSRSIEYL